MRTNFGAPALLVLIACDTPPVPGTYVGNPGDQVFRLGDGVGVEVVRGRA